MNYDLIKLLHLFFQILRLREARPDRVLAGDSFYTALHPAVVCSDRKWCRGRARGRGPKGTPRNFWDAGDVYLNYDGFTMYT